MFCIFISLLFLIKFIYEHGLQDAMPKYFEKLTIKQMMKLENPWDDYFEYGVEVK